MCLNYAISPTGDIGTDWHHLAMVYDGTQSGNENRLQAYIDGKQITLAYTGTIPKTMPAVSGNVNIGRHSTANFFNGIIDEVAVFNVALTEDEIQSIITKGLKASAAVFASDQLIATWSAIKSHSVK